MPIKNTIAKLLIVFSSILSFTATASTNDQGRQTISFNSDWQFHFAYNFEQNIKKESVNLPHTWNAQETLKGIADYNRTSGIYENTLMVGPEWKNKRLFLYFEGANSVATIFINNKFVQEHNGGYTAFCVEVTNFVKPGKNSIKVQVSNAYRLDVLPLHGDFNVYGGIHRPVSLIVTNQNCISPLDHGSAGVYLNQQRVSNQSAQIKVLSKLSILNSVNNLSLKTTIYNKDKKIVSTTVSVIGNGNSKEATQDFNITKPHLWNGKANPYLYTVVVSLWQNEQLIDQVTQPLGLRYFNVDPEKGFFLNGKYLDLYGVGRHEDFAGKGSALSNVDHDSDMQLIKEIGATAARLTHYPQNKHFYDLCDQNGIILWSEIPFVGPGGYTGTGYLKTASLEASVKTTLTELIRQNYNHPSICFWGLFNELKLDHDDPRPFIKELNELAKKEDPSRLTTLASNLSEKEFTDLTDLMGWNQYFGWYGGDFDDIGMWADKTHKALPNKPISVSEYGAGASPFKHVEELKKISPKGKFHPEEWQTAFHEEHWLAFKKRPFIWCKFVWVLADFGSSIRTEGDDNSINDKGLVTYNRAIKKDAFYFYKANWNPQPMLYIAERRNTVRYNPITTIKVFSNLKSAELWVNGKKLGEENKNELNIMLWENVKLNPGTNKIVVRTKSDGKLLEDSCEWTMQVNEKGKNSRIQD